MWLTQGVRKEGLPFSSTFVLKLLTFGLCALPRQTSPIRTQPRSSLWANGELWGPLICCLTLYTLMRSLPRRRIWAFKSNFGMNLAIGCKWGWQSATSGIGISDLLLRISLHSMSGGRSMLTPPLLWRLHRYWVSKDVGWFECQRSQRILNEPRSNYFGRQGLHTCWLHVVVDFSCTL